MSRKKIDHKLQKSKIKKGDLVIITTGKDKGKSGAIKKVLYSTGKVIVNNCNVVKCFNKRKREILGRGDTKEMPLDISNVAHVDPKTKDLEVKQPTRVRVMIKDDKKVLVAKKSGEIIREISKLKENKNV